MVGSCIVAFLCGVEALTPIHDLLKEFRERGSDFPPKTYCESKQVDTSEELRARKFRKHLLLMNVSERINKNHLNSFLQSYYNVSTIDNYSLSNVRQKSASKDFEYKYRVATNIERYCEFLEYVVIN